MADRFHAPDLARAAGAVTLEGQEARHLAQVLRAAPGDAVELFDGRGTVAVGTVLHVEKRAVEIRLDSVSLEPESRRLRAIATCLPKGDRGEFLIEKLTELGVDRVIPLRSRRSVAELTESRREKFERLILESCKQCRRARALTIDPETPLERLLTDPSFEPSARLLLDPGGDPIPSRSPLFRGVPTGEHTEPGIEIGSARGEANGPNEAGSPATRVVAIGPEGGWAPEELARARELGWSIRRLPTPILRIETAAIAAAALLATEG